MSVKSKDIPLNFENSAGAESSSRMPSMRDKKAVRWLLKAMNGAPIAIELWDGDRIQVTDAQVEAVVKINTRKALWSVVTDPDLHVGEAYSTGALEVDGDLVDLIEMATIYRPRFLEDGAPLNKVFKSLGRARSNTLSGSKSNIHHHYDLSNDFYKLWLDKDHMQYTCAYFENQDQSIEQAQNSKLHHVCRKLRLQPGDEVIEAGCGWGGLALFMAREYGARVRAYNISEEQIKFARNKAKEEGLHDRVQYVEDDYRNADGACDVFVSIGMLEHVGTKNYGALGNVIDRCLRADGRGLIHSIGRNKPRLMNRWIEKRIFPGAYPPTIKEMMDIFEPNNFSVYDIENLRLHYASTLEHWLERFEDNVNVVNQMFGETFVRAWRFYLSGSIAAFRTGELQLFQVVFNRGTDNNVPWTRRHIYD